MIRDTIVTMIYYYLMGSNVGILYGILKILLPEILPDFLIIFWFLFYKKKLWYFLSISPILIGIISGFYMIHSE